MPMMLYRCLYQMCPSKDMFHPGNFVGGGGVGISGSQYIYIYIYVYIYIYIYV